MTGVEFDKEAAVYAAQKNADCLVFSTADFFRNVPRYLTTRSILATCSNTYRIRQKHCVNCCFCEAGRIAYSGGAAGD